MKHYVLCLVDTDDAAQEVTEKVASAGIAKEELFVFASGRGNVDDSAGQREAKAGERRSLNEGTGPLAGIGPAVVGGGGLFMGAGRTMDASDSGEIGVEQGEAAAFLNRFGLSKLTARQYQNRLAEGGTLIAVQVDGQKTAAVARKIFEESRGQEISEV
jgi:Heat induced stress protein YflT